MKFRFNKEGGHFTPKSKGDLVGLCIKKGNFANELHFRDFEGNQRGEKFFVLDECGHIIGFSDTDQFDPPQYDPEEHPVMIQIQKHIDEIVEATKAVQILIKQYKTK